MALGSQDIDHVKVKNSTGEGRSSNSALVSSDLVNRWGFNIPDYQMQQRYWGNLLPVAPFNLGAFRNYDHWWRCYNIGEVEIGEDLIYYDQDWLNFNVGFFPVWSTPTSGVQHTFDVWFSRNNNFNRLDLCTQIKSDYVVYDGTYLGVLIQPATGPDGSALTPDSDVYFRIKHKTSDARRWDKRFRLVDDTSTFWRDPNDDDAWIVKVHIGHNVFSNAIMISQSTPPSNTIAKTASFANFALHAENGYAYPQSIRVYVEACNVSDFSSEVKLIIHTDITIPAGSRSGGMLITGKLDFSVNDTLSLSKWAIGETFYGRIGINAMPSGGVDFTGTVTSMPIPD
jgi:hypothetical protein